MGIKTPTLQELAAKQAITEVIHRYCRGLDRMDRELTLSCWHPGGTDDHAPLYTGSAEGFVDWLWPVHAAMPVTRHVVSNTIIDLNGDKAGAETYWSLVLRVEQEGKLWDIIVGGRYLDAFECIDEVWAIRHRSSIRDTDRVELVEKTLMDFLSPPLIMPNNPEAAAQKWARDRSDFSYQLVGRPETKMAGACGGVP
jgi:hypothetical protein